MAPRYEDKSKRLTAKQERFVEAVASGESSTLTDAYLEAGYGSTEGKRETLHVNASHLASSTKLAPRIAERKEAIAREMEAKHAGGRRWVLRRLQEEASDMDSTANARVNALAQLAKATGLHSERSAEEKRASATEEQLVDELTSRLDAYFPGLSAVDLQPDSLDVTPEGTPEDAESPEDGLPY